jgi:hypothetical protein
MSRLAIIFAMAFLAPAFSSAHEMEAEPQPAMDHSPHYNANFNVKMFLGGRDITDRAWADYRRQFVVGADFDIKDPAWPFSVFISLAASASGSQSVGSSTTTVSAAGGTTTVSNPLSVSGFLREFDFGLRRYFLDNSPFSPYVSLGVGLVDAGILDDTRYNSRYGGGHSHGGWNGDENSYDDFTYGVFLNAGFDMRVMHGRVGMDIRAVVGTPKMRIVYPGGTINGKGDYIQAAVTFGFGM